MIGYDICCYLIWERKMMLLIVNFKVPKLPVCLFGKLNLSACAIFITIPAWPAWPPPGLLAHMSNLAYIRRTVKGFCMDSFIGSKDYARYATAFTD